MWSNFTDAELGAIIMTLENLIARTVAGARSGMNEYELRDHRREQIYRPVGGYLTNSSSSVNSISEEIY